MLIAGSVGQTRQAWLGVGMALAAVAIAGIVIVTQSGSNESLRVFVDVAHATVHDGLLDHVEAVNESRYHAGRDQLRASHDAAYERGLQRCAGAQLRYLRPDRASLPPISWKPDVDTREVLGFVWLQPTRQSLVASGLYEAHRSRARAEAPSPCPGTATIRVGSPDAVEAVNNGTDLATNTGCSGPGVSARTSAYSSPTACFALVALALRFRRTPAFALRQGSRPQHQGSTGCRWAPSLSPVASRRLLTPKLAASRERHDVSDSNSRPLPRALVSEASRASSSPVEPPRRGRVRFTVGQAAQERSRNPGGLRRSELVGDQPGDSDLQRRSEKEDRAGCWAPRLPWTPFSRSLKLAGITATSLGAGRGDSTRTTDSGIRRRPGLINRLAPRRRRLERAQPTSMGRLRRDHIRG